MKTFEEIHDEGSTKYGWLWLKASQVTTQVAEYYKLDVTKEPMKTALSAISLGFLNRVLSPTMVNVYHQLKSAWWQSWAVLMGALPEPKDDKVAKFAEKQFNTWADQEAEWSQKEWKGDSKARK